MEQEKQDASGQYINIGAVHRQTASNTVIVVAKAFKYFLLS